MTLQGFAGEIIGVEERYDSFDRSIQLVPVVKQERGALRWLGDMIFNGLGKDESHMTFTKGQLYTPDRSFFYSQEYLLRRW